MAPLTIVRIRELVRAKQYVLTSHAVDELYDDELSLGDLEQSLLTGEILFRQVDQVTSESKLVVAGLGMDGSRVVVVLKLGFTGKLVIITVYRD